MLYSHDGSVVPSITTLFKAVPGALHFLHAHAGFAVALMLLDSAASPRS